MIPGRGVATLFVPRPLDLLVKSPLVIGAFLVRTWSTRFDTTTSSWVTLVMAIVAFEFCFYQGRYLLNDISERGLDRAHPAAQDRARLAGLDGVSSPWLVVGALLRIGAGVVLALGFEGHNRALILSAIAAAAGAAMVYEYLRSRVRSLRFDPALLDGPRPIHRYIYGAVGLGYAIRIALGIGLAGGDELRVAIPAVVYGWAFGLMFVTMTWTLEASCLLSDKQSDGTARRKSHVVALATFVRSGSCFKVSEPVLRSRASFVAPWVWSTVLASGAAGWLGWMMVGPTDLLQQSLLAGIAVVCSFVVARFAEATWTLIAWSLGGTIAIFAAASFAETNRSWLAGVPFLIVLTTHVVFRHLRAVDIGLSPRDDAKIAT